MLSKILDVLILPDEISAFEARYLAKTNRLSTQFFLLHIPIFTAVAWGNRTGPVSALLLTSLVALGPVVANAWLRNSRSVGLVCAVAAMLMGGLLVHFGQGPVQIEMHFYFFAVLAMLALYGNPLAIVAAAVTVALHHLLLWLVLPSSVFNYAAPWWVVAVHAGFVVLESVAAIYIARSFFDNVIGLERLVQERTAQLDARSKAMRLVLDNIDQGLLTIDRAGLILPEFSTAIQSWFGAPESGQSLATFFSKVDASFAQELALAWDQCLDGYLPLELCLAQAPAKLKHAGEHYRFSYCPIQDADEQLTGMLITIANVSADLAAARLQLEQHETLSILDRVVQDRAGFMEFLQESEELLACVASPLGGEVIVKRALHTLKGNCMIFGVQTIADICHAIESELAAGQGLPSAVQTEELNAAWLRLTRRLNSLLGGRNHQRIEIEPSQFDELLRASLEKRPHAEIGRMLADLKLEPTAARLQRVAAQAARIAERLDKHGIDVQIEHSMLRLDPLGWASFWSAFIHVVRNAVDHGLESTEWREEKGKLGPGKLTLKTAREGSDFSISISDDGRGIDWERVAERAKDAGLPHTRREDLVNALFAQGISTAEQVTEYSGRGMGLYAVQAACAERGGRIQVESEPGRGTSFIFRFPADTMAPQPQLGPESFVQRARVA